MLGLSKLKAEDCGPFPWWRPLLFEEVREIARRDRNAMGTHDDRADELRRLRRLIVERWPEGRGREVALRVLDDMVWDARAPAGAE